MQRLKIISIYLLLIQVMFGLSVTNAADQWHFQAELKVPQQGLIEAVLPPGLLYTMDATRQKHLLDLSLIGPDGNPRSFELYWREDIGVRSVVLESSRVYLDKRRGLIWEATAPERFKIEDIKIDFAGPQDMGKVSVQGKDSRGWHLLSENAALYHAEDRLKADIHIDAAEYERLRLRFTGYDKEFRETPFVVKSVTVSGRNIAKDYAEKEISLHFDEDNQNDKRAISALLPGSGLWIKKLVLSTEAQFQGRWELGSMVILGGKPQFTGFLSGNITTVGRAGAGLEIPVDRVWPGRSLVLNLDPEGKYLGSVTEMRITANQPRIVFLADKAGVYLAQSGNGNKVPTRETPGDQKRQIDKVLSFSEVTENRLWKPESLVEKFMIEGGPFIEKGYRWTARINIPEPGYYRLRMNEDVSLSPNPAGIRLVRDGMQVPYFRGQSELQEINLQAESKYDGLRNTSFWTIKLPEHLNKGTAMTIESDGIFDRSVILEIPKPGRTGWQQWKGLHWQNPSNTSAVLHIGLEGLPKDISEMRITIEHGDNRPIEIRRIKAVYYAPTILFLINKPGEYTLFGGNPDVSEAKYDLALVQVHLMDTVPKPAMMEELKPIHPTGLKPGIREFFYEKTWGLYAVLGLVTIALMILIIRLFPKEGNKEEK
jgi:hypothetical protein